VTGSSPVMADKKRGQCAFGQDAQAQKSAVNLSCGKSYSGSISIGNRVQLMFLARENKTHGLYLNLIDQKTSHFY
jgi:hypothetical protein